MKCTNCNSSCIRKGLTKEGIQKLRCKSCGRYQREDYLRHGCNQKVLFQIKTLVKEGCGIRSISRVLKISTSTVLKYIKKEADKINKPELHLNKYYEVDELKTLVKRKSNEQWIIYAINKRTREVADFRIGKRNKTNLKNLIDSLILSKARLIFTDKLNIYRALIPTRQHINTVHNTNYIERKNLDLRTHLKRLSRKSICFSKSIVMLNAVMKIYFWG